MKLKDQHIFISGFFGYKLPGICIILLLPLLASTQNLVPNPSFEESGRCPFGRFEFSENMVTGWRGNANYYNSCSEKFSVPGNIDGYQEASHGSAYVNVSTFYDLDKNKSFIGCRLNKTLKKGYPYRIGLKSSPADNQGKGHPPSVAVFYSNNLGLRFFTDLNFNSFKKPEDNFSHLKSDEIHNDTTSWKTLSDTFIADYNYNFLVIANFYDTPNTKIIRPVTGNHIFIAWYYIDEVEVTPVPMIKISPVTFCGTKEVTVSTTYAEDFYWYRNGDATDTFFTDSLFSFFPEETTSLTFSSDGGNYTETYTIEVFPAPKFTLPPDTQFCGNSLILDASNPGAEYLWSTGEESSQIEVFKTGLYSVKLTTLDCIESGKIYVKFCDPEIFIPNAFSPNEDGINDIFLPVLSRVKSYSIVIFNRWGERIFASSDQENGWDGGGHPEGEYFFLINADQALESGSLLLMR